VLLRGELSLPPAELSSADEQWSKSAALLKNASKGLGEESYPFLIDGQTPRPGDLFSNPALGATLKSIGEKGAKAYYTGENAQAIVDGEFFVSLTRNMYGC